MKTVKFYNKTTGRWEPIAGISTLGGVSDYNDLSNKPDLSVYALKSELEALREELTNLINSQEPDSQYYTEYTIDNSVSTFSLRSVDNPINNGQYIPQFSDGYDYIKITLTDGNVTTNLNTSASEVEKIKIYYPAETAYIKFADTKVKDVEYINGANITDVTSMFQNCSSLESANLSTLDSSKVSVDNTMFMGANTDVQLQFNDEWSYTNRDMGLIKMVDVVMYHYREDGLYENSSIYLKSKYDENPVQYVIIQVDPEDERWRYEPFTLEYDVTYEIYFEDNGNTGETMSACFTDNMDIFFVGALPGSFTDTRPEIGGNEEPEEEYITGFTCDERLDIVRANTSCYLSVIPDQLDRPMNFEVVFPDSSWSAVTYNVNINPDGEVPVVIGFTLMSNCLAFDGIATIRETNSGITKDIHIYVDPRVNITVHYKDTDGNISDTLYIGDSIICNFDNLGEGSGTDDYGVFISGYTLNAFQSYMLRLEASSGIRELGQINLSNDTEIWISEDSDEVLYENPNQPEEPSGEPVTLTLHYNRKNGDYENWDVWNWCLDGAHEIPESTEFTGEDDFGKIAYIQATSGCQVGYIIRMNDWSDKNHSNDQSITITQDTEIWVVQGQDGYYTERPNIDEVYPDESDGQLTILNIHYNRVNGDYDNYKLFSWGSTDEDGFIEFTSEDGYGKIAVASFNSQYEIPNFGFDVYKEVEGSEWYENKDGGDKFVDLSQLILTDMSGVYFADIYIMEGSDEVYYTNPHEG